ncbi:MAG: nicotinate (nicotinamide) nucleotide adenylyltransferase, partial [Bacteroidales bacterium]
MRIGLLFGSFNPVHLGHLMLANYCIEYSPIDELWFVISPHNPLKHTQDLMSKDLRLNLLKIAIKHHQLPMKICDIEFSLPTPSYTIDTMRNLTTQYPQHVFSIIMGGDSLANMEKWKFYKTLLSTFQFIVYPRRGYEAQISLSQCNIMQVNAPHIEISSTFIRKAMLDGRNMSTFVPVGTYPILKEILNN